MLGANYAWIAREIAVCAGVGARVGIHTPVQCMRVPAGIVGAGFGEDEGRRYGYLYCDKLAWMQPRQRAAGAPGPDCIREGRCGCVN